MHSIRLAMAMLATHSSGGCDSTGMFPAANLTAVELASPTVEFVE